MDSFTEDVLRRTIALIIEDCGWSRTDMTSLDVLTGVMKDFIVGLIRKAGNMAYLCNKSQLEVSHVLYAIRSLSFDIEDLKEFMSSSQPPRSPLQVPKYPVRSKYRSPMQVMPKDVSEYNDSVSEESEAGNVVVPDEPPVGEPFSSSEATDVEPENSTKNRRGKEAVLESEITELPHMKNKYKKKHKSRGKHKKSKKNCKCRKHK